MVQHFIERRTNISKIDDSRVSIALSETTTMSDIIALSQGFSDLSG